MKITVSKHQVQEAMMPLSKIANMSDLLLIGTKGFFLSFTVTTSFSQLSMKIPMHNEEVNSCHAVNVHQFKAAIALCESTVVELDLSEAKLIVRSDDHQIGDIPYLPAPKELLEVGSEADSTSLPTGFAGFLLQAFTGVSNDMHRLPMQGVYVSNKGIASTDCKQLIHIALPLSLKSGVILPQSTLYYALRKYRWGTLAWEGEYVAIRGVGFELILRRNLGTYPGYESVFPPSNTLDVNVSLSETDAPKLTTYLKAIPKANDSAIDLVVYSDHIECKDQQGCKLSIDATCDCTRLPSGICCNAKYLLQMLAFGHSKFSFSSYAVGAVVATGGTGRYLFMPLHGRPELPASKDAETASEDAVPVVATIQPTTNEKEKSTMTPVASTPIVPTATNNITITPTTPAPAVQPKSAAPQEQLDPLTELSASITAMREQLDELNARLAEAGRKIREALVAQRQKERIYQEANRKLERIRMAV